eukprot:CAMPEP_0198721774 /NCGR_PEP_ID=MMETSP1471-20131121/65049_1 /TAXON_ID=41880 /ORGANISM="Pycnococcus provasolii, Strain RCC733" /LENGTH=273 /DNA_ID=CAMNT_0044482667 /DNA_START=1081 /DNA_END=1903 /DNA_ORIENTATION=-
MVVSSKAAPKCISGRTSYLRVRLAFHPYPQVIPAFCNRHGFGPPRACSARFTLPKGRSPGFGSTERNLPPFGLAFAPAPAVRCLNLATPNHSLAHSTKGTPSLPKELRPAGGTWFQGLFHSPQSGCFSPFPHGTGSLSVGPEAHGFRVYFTPLSRGAFHRSLTVLVHYRSHQVFSLGSWATLLPTGFRVSGGTHDHGPWRLCACPYGTLTLFGRPFQRRSASHRLATTGLPPRPTISFNPTPAAAVASYAGVVWALPGSLAATTGILSVPRGT